MRAITVLVALLFALTMSSTVIAQGRGNGQAKKTAAGSQTKVKASSPKTGGAKGSTNASAPKPKHETKHAAKAESQAAKKAAKSSTTSVATTTPTTEVTPTTPTTTSVKNPKLEARLQAMLPGGMTVQDAKQGFRNWGQFVAAVHVSNNLGLPFDQLKSLMTGIPILAPGTTPTTPPVPTMAPMSLGQAIQTLKATALTTQPPSTTTPTPTTSRPTGTTPTTRTASTTSTSMSETQIRAEVKKAEDAARADLRRTRETS